MDASIIENEKENIKPLVFGRCALKLGKALVESRAPSLLSKQREKFETDLQSDELDDPLQVYVDFIAWTHNHYPQGANSESGLLHLLERCTSCFRDTAHYKNDPRYLKIWLEYAEYSNSPRDIFVYLAKKSIGQELALYYEQFASFLESKGLTTDAREVFEIGIEKNAWPVKRLQRSFDHFVARSGALETLTPDTSSATKRPLASTVWSESSQPMKKSKLEIHQDLTTATLKETVFAQNPSARINSAALTAKENHISARPWAGEIVKQNELADVDKKPAKFEVFRDNEPSQTEGLEYREENGQTFTLMSQPGKPREKIYVNMKLLYPTPDTEVSLGELLAMSQIERYPEKLKCPTPIKNLVEYRERDQTFTIPLRDDDTVHKPKSPTITMMSRMATNDVLGMFNDAAANANLDDETSKEFEDSTNYDGFHTETIHVESQEIDRKPGPTISTPPTDHYITDEGSSPLLERP
ncbi:hypothetical protein METBIDRAFT_221572 [Metschnikowia bicuspidata var. bicuspidata NRRL YB-4993]|uniref:BUB1 N-terminal domain-containing protein n=1 Tax=Metschnikowia bicuspidata var. bicuspidata NRRL YB-4993 TaxID=869754 RepID=A0A1A0H5X0_9ASCO|nr:hypothetical protein METBIDRAFT_221572 [Metschnikowia bicuspidata var. bicuspidata NRRL YB-4993]OBA19313.1 hypothetical protein METBIDRAFT_221572 [Metschnikowia bicuspidata var. bicuspidata NRRL YB-4993]